MHKVAKISRAHAQTKFEPIYLQSIGCIVAHVDVARVDEMKGIGILKLFISTLMKRFSSALNWI